MYIMESTTFLSQIRYYLLQVTIPFYPGTGNENEIGVGNIFNCPLPSGCDSIYLENFFKKL